MILALWVKIWKYLLGYSCTHIVHDEECALQCVLNVFSMMTMVVISVALKHTMMALF